MPSKERMLSYNLVLRCLLRTNLRILSIKKDYNSQLSEIDVNMFKICYCKAGI